MDGRTHKHGIRPTGGQKYLNIYMQAKFKKMVSRLNTRKNCSHACAHRPHTLVRTHTHPRINIEVRSKIFGVRNKENRGHAYMHQT